jgi:DNA recombination protein RmuC
MQTLLTILFILAILIIVGLIYFLLKKPKQDNSSLLIIQEQLKEIRGTLDLKIGESTKAIQQQFGQTAKIVKDVTERLTKLDETNKQVISFADQLQKLQNILKNPKQRGVLGEYYLETLLKNAFQPKQYQMQYRFKDGETVDAALFVGDKIIPVDSKFSLENYNRIVEETDLTKKEELENLFKQDLKKRIDETAKYIRPQEGTTDFAFMFIPAEGIYYDLLINKLGTIKANTRDLIDYAINEKRVHVVSPTTFYVTLQSMWQGMRAYQIQKETEGILKNIGQLEKHLKVYGEFHNKLGSHIQTVANTYNNTSKEFGKIDKDFLNLIGESTGIEPKLLDKSEEID